MGSVKTGVSTVGSSLFATLRSMGVSILTAWTRLVVVVEVATGRW